MLPIRTIGALFLALVSSLLAKEQEFRFEKPDAQTVDLMAEFNQWKSLPMTKQPNGMWTIMVSIPPGTYGYKFLVDGIGMLMGGLQATRTPEEKITHVTISSPLPKPVVEEE
jgi:1,4-alpha-glucan branching enzyme